MSYSPTPTPVRPMHHRAPRRWPELRTEPVVLPYPMPQDLPPATTLFVTGASVLGIIASLFFFGRSGGAGMGLGIFAISGVTALASLGAFFIQRGAVARKNKDLLRRYHAQLDEVLGSVDRHKPGEAEKARLAEFQARWQNDPPLVQPDIADRAAMALVPRVMENPAYLWQRRPEDPDFLRVRIGVGPATPRFEVKFDRAGDALRAPDRDEGFRFEHERAESAIKYYAQIENVPVTIPLRDHAAVAIVDGPTGTAAAGLARALVGYIALQHSPREAQVVVVAPAPARTQWDWVRGLAHDGQIVPALAVGDPDTREPAMERLLAELNRREQALSDRNYDRSRPAPLPHLIVFVDTLQQPSDPRLTGNPAVELAMRRGKELGVTVVSLHRYFDQAPAQATLAVDLRESKLLYLWPDPPPAIICTSIDHLTVPECQRVTHALSRFVPEEEAAQQIPSQVRLLDLFTPPIRSAQHYDIEQTWGIARGAAAVNKAAGRQACPIPLGKGYARQPFELDLVADGPHGLLIGQTGSGKSELLRSIIAALAIRYPPDMVNFVLVDYKGGIELEVFNQLPHTLTVLTNLMQAGQTARFLTMLESELQQRQELRKQGKDFPRLFVIIDEFAEMVARRTANDNPDAIMESILRILRLGRALDVHLLFASQRPEGAIIGKLRGYVQYRISLRTNTDEDSKEVLGVPDAARIPLDQRGRGYLLRGDSNLQPFQAGRVAMTDGAAPQLGVDLPTTDQIIAERMKPLGAQYAVARWPQPLPTPSHNTPTPLILALRGGLTRAADAWDAKPRPELPPMVVPLGLVDRPSQRAQEWFAADLFGHADQLHGGPLLVMGDLNAGKTTSLQTLLLYCATHYTPTQLRWYALDPTGAFSAFAGLPHAQDLLEPERTNIIDGLDENEFKAFKARLERAVDVDRPNGSPALLLLIDDYDDLATRYGPTAKPLLHELAQWAIRGRPRQLYLVIAAAKQGFDTLPQPIVSGMSTKIALYMSNRDNIAALLGGRVPFVPDPVPGRGFVLTRSSLDEIQIAAPVYGRTEADRLVALRAVIEERSRREG